MIELGRDICGDLQTATEREWLVTNGLGGFASGTVSGVLTRRYHGLLVAALKPPLGRTLLLARLDETATYDERTVALHASRWANRSIDPEGFRFLECFSLEGAVPVWTYALADALLEKRVWMEQGANTTYVRYTLLRASLPLTLSVKALVNHRDYHANTHAGTWQMRVEPVANGLRVTAAEGATPFVVLSAGATVTPAHVWYRNYYLAVEDGRGLDPYEDHLHAGTLDVTLEPGSSLTIVASTEESPSPDGEAALSARRTHEADLLRRAAATLPGSTEGGEDGALLRQLVLAADQFIVRRPLPDEPVGETVIAGYPWFGDWGRDTMIALPGLTLATGRPESAARILRTFARYLDQGMLPNRFPDAGEAPEYNTVDATLWYVEAVRAYLAATGDDALARDLFPALAEIVTWHQRGTRYGVQMDPADGLLRAGEPGVQLTWMDARVGDWVVTPRTGKPVEINALWYNALCSIAELARRIDRPAEEYEATTERARQGFARFWNTERGFLYDVLDGPEGNDPRLRPNQILAASLAHSPLPPEQQRAVVDVCARRLLTSHGLRSLAPGEPGYTGRYGGPAAQRDAVYHQGPVWAWLIGPFVSAHFRVYGDRKAARSYLHPLLRNLQAAGLGSISEIFEGDPPFHPDGCPAQAWSVAELLRVLGDVMRDA